MLRQHSRTWTRALSALVIGTSLLLIPAMARSADPAPLSGAALKKECVDAGTAMPELKRAIIISRGYKDDQFIYLHTHHEPLPEECNAVFRREITVKVQIRQSFRGAGTVTLADQTLYVGNSGGMGVLTKGPGGHNGWPEKQLYRCTPGPKKTEVFGLLDRRVVSLSTRRIVGRKLGRLPFRVEAPC